MMLSRKKNISLFFLFVGICSGGALYFHNQVYYSRGEAQNAAKIKIRPGENIFAVAEDLEEKQVISRKAYFFYYILRQGLREKIISGEYTINPGLTIPDVAFILSNSTELEPEEIKLTFPEGWNNKNYKLQITNYKLSGDEFQQLTQDPVYFKEKYGYEFLNNIPPGQSLEGYLFPDTYFFFRDDNAENIIKKMLDNFDRKLSANLRDEIKKQGKTIHEIITMASTIEGEVQSETDRKVVSGIFWKRIQNGQALESCATLAFILGENKKQYSYADTRTPSSYNTYLNPGLPPGPINNPGRSSIEAAIFPEKSDYNYFLSDPQTGKTIFSETLEEHNLNKIKYGL